MYQRASYFRVESDLDADESAAAPHPAVAAREPALMRAS
jgi:hypothetical protein